MMAHPCKGWVRPASRSTRTSLLSNTATATSRLFSNGTPLRKYSENVASFAKARDELLVAYDEGIIDYEEFYGDISLVLHEMF